MIDSGVMHNAMINAVQALQTSEGIKNLVVSLNKSFPDNISASYVNIVKIGGGRRSFCGESFVWCTCWG